LYVDQTSEFRIFVSG